MQKIRVGGYALVYTLLTLAGTAAAQSHYGTAMGPRALADLSLEQLRDIVVTTVSREQESLARTPASVVVITAEQIRRSGANTLVEALRLAPTLFVARADAVQSVVTARGFGNVLANKMLVLVDGRTLYTPLFSGVFWEAQDVDLDAVDRIEVITGPSTALWGTNAVNGLIHIITRDAAATQDFSASAEWGEDRRIATVRNGLALGGGFVRAYAKVYRRDTTRRADGSAVFDDARGHQLGFRGDWRGLMGGSLTLQGDAYDGDVEQPPSPRSFDGANLIGRWQRQVSNEGQLELQATLERSRRAHALQFAETLRTADFAGQWSVVPRPGHRVLLGAGWRRAHDEVSVFPALTFTPPTRRLNWSRLFVQDRWTLAPTWQLDTALSIERNPYTGTESLPSLRLAWQPRADTVLWLGRSRAARAPSRIDRDFFQPSKPPFLVAGGPDFRSEIADVTELGLRMQPTPSLSYSVALYRHDWSGLRSLAPTPVGLQFQNGFDARVAGGEAWLSWVASRALRVDAGGGWLRQRIVLRPGSRDVPGRAALGNDPPHWASIRLAVDPLPGWSWSLALRRAGALPSPAVPAYTAADIRLNWQVRAGLELALSILNLGDPSHPEWGTAGNRVEFRRTTLLQLHWQP